MKAFKCGELVETVRDYNFAGTLIPKGTRLKIYASSHSTGELDYELKYGGINLFLSSRSLATTFKFLR